MCNAEFEIMGCGHTKVLKFEPCSSQRAEGPYDFAGDSHYILGREDNKVTTKDYCCRRTCCLRMLRELEQRILQAVHAREAFRMNVRATGLPMSRLGMHRYQELCDAVQLVEAERRGFHSVCDGASFKDSYLVLIDTATITYGTLRVVPDAELTAVQEHAPYWTTIEDGIRLGVRLVPDQVVEQ